MPRLLRTNKGSSKVSRSLPSVLDIAGWVMESLSAALDTLPSSSKICSATSKLRSILARRVRFTCGPYNVGDCVQLKKYIRSNDTSNAPFRQVLNIGGWVYPFRPNPTQSPIQPLPASPRRVFFALYS